MLEFLKIVKKTVFYSAFPETKAINPFSSIRLVLEVIHRLPGIRYTPSELASLVSIVALHYYYISPNHQRRFEPLRKLSRRQLTLLFRPSYVQKGFHVERYPAITSS